MNCEYCGAQTTDAYLCKNHANRLRNVLHDLAEAWTDSEITLARLDKHAPQAGGGHSTKHTQLAFNTNCSDVRHESNDVILMWAREVGRGRMPGWLRTVPQQCRWLAESAHDIAGMDFAGQMLRELEDELAELHRAVDRPADRILAGQCDICGHDLTAPLDSDTAMCPFCEVVVNVKQRRDQRIAEALSKLADITELIRVVPLVYRIRVTEKTIQRWVTRGELTEYGGMYRIGDVVRLAERVALRRTSA